MATKEVDNGKSWKVLRRGEGGSPLLERGSSETTYVSVNR